MYPIAYTLLITLSLHQPNLLMNSYKNAPERLGAATEVNPGSKVLCEYLLIPPGFITLPHLKKPFTIAHTTHPPWNKCHRLSKPTVGIRPVVTVIASDERFKSSHQLETSRHYHPVSVTLLYDHGQFVTFSGGSTTIRSRSLYDVPLHCSRWHTCSN